MRLAVIYERAASRRDYDFIRIFSYSQRTNALANRVVTLLRSAIPVQAVAVRAAAYLGLTASRCKRRGFAIYEAADLAFRSQCGAVIYLRRTGRRDRHSGRINLHIGLDSIRSISRHIFHANIDSILFNNIALAAFYILISRRFSSPILSINRILNCIFVVVAAYRHAVRSSIISVLVRHNYDSTEVTTPTALNLNVLVRHRKVSLIPTTKDITVQRRCFGYLHCCAIFICRLSRNYRNTRRNITRIFIRYLMRINRPATSEYNGIRRHSKRAIAHHRIRGRPAAKGIAFHGRISFHRYRFANAIIFRRRHSRCASRSILSIFIRYRKLIQIVMQVYHCITISSDRGFLLFGIDGHIQRIVFDLDGIICRSRALITRPAILRLGISVNIRIFTSLSILQNILYSIRCFINLLIGKGYFGALFGRRQHSGAGQLPHVLHAIFRAAGNHLIARAGLRILQVGLIIVLSNRIFVLILVMDGHLPGGQLGVVEDDAVVPFHEGMVHKQLIGNIARNFRRVDCFRRAYKTRLIVLFKQRTNRLLNAVVINVCSNRYINIQRSRNSRRLFGCRHPLGPDIPILSDGRIDKPFVQRAGALIISIPAFEHIAFTADRSILHRRNFVCNSILIVGAVFAVIRRAQRMALIHAVRSVGIISAGVIQMILNSLDRRKPLCKYLHIMRGHSIFARVYSFGESIIIIPTVKHVFGINTRGLIRYYFTQIDDLFVFQISS